MRKNATFNLLKRGKTWYALIYDPERHPAQIQRTLRTREKSIARRKLVDWERDYVDGRFDPWAKKKRPSENITVREAVKKFREERRSNSAEATIRSRGSRLHVFADWIDDGTPIKAVQPHHIEDFFAQGRDDLGREGVVRPWTVNR